MPSVTSWLRLEPRGRDAEMKTSLQARIYDPLWLLTRQWQLGEFQGEDNGSPVGARWVAEAAPVTRYHAGPIAPNTLVDAPHYDAGRMPLESLVEREAVRVPKDQPDTAEKLRLAAEAGQHFLRLLDREKITADARRRYRNAFITQYAFQPLSPEQRETIDRDSLAFIDLLTGRVPDARRLAAAFLSPTPGQIELDSFALFG